MPKKPTTVEASDSESSPEPVLKKTKAAKVDPKSAKPAAVATKAKVAQTPSSDEDDTPPTNAKKAQTKPAGKVQPKKESSSDEEESDQIAKKRKLSGGAKATTAKTPVVKGQKKPESDSESEDAQIVNVKQIKKVVPQKKAQKSSSESEDEKPQNAKGKAGVVKAPPAKVAIKKGKEESESEEEEPKTAKNAKVVKNSKSAPVKKAPAKKVSQSDSDSDLESEDEAPKTSQPKKQSPKTSPKTKPVVAAKGKAPKKSLDLNEDESEQEAPKQDKKARKVSKDSSVKDSKKPVKGKKAEDEPRGQYEVYVKGIAWTVGEKELEELFGTYGEVTASRLLRKEDGKSRGIGFVTFALDSSRKAALELNGTNQFGRELGVEEAKGKQPNDFGGRADGNARGGKPAFGGASYDKPIPENIESTTIFVGNLSFHTTPDSLRSFFGSIGTVVDSRIVTDKETGRNKGFGYVQFDSVESVKSAFALRGQDLDGRAINVDVASERKSAPGGAGGFRGPPRDGGYQSNRGGFNNNRSTNVSLSRDDQMAKKGAIGEFKGKKIAL